jgi:hypothetical protein
MSAARRRHPQGRRRTAAMQQPFDLWQPAPPMADPAPIAPPSDVTALLRSLGDPPLPGQGAVALRYLGAVVERAAGLAAALAASAELLALPEQD